jgi:hypothetical protein
MTRNDKSNPFQTVLELLADEGFDGFAAALEILLNEAMKLERAAVLQAKPYQRTPQRRGHANGFKPKTILNMYITSRWTPVPNRGVIATVGYATSSFTKPVLSP